jgi:hypothetical protein
VVAAIQKKEWKSATWVLVLWLVVPVVVFTVAGLWTYLTYFAILLPAHFLVCGAGAQRLKPAMVLSLAGLLVAVNVVFLLDYYRFVERNGGAHGTFGTALEHKLAASRYLAERGGQKLREQGEIQLALATARTQAEREALVKRLGQPVFWELSPEGKPELPQLEWPVLIAQVAPGGGATGAVTIVMVDGNREALTSTQWNQYPSTNFGPIRLYFVKP